MFRHPNSQNAATLLCIYLGPDNVGVSGVPSCSQIVLKDTF